MREPVAGKLAVADRDLLEALGAPDIAIHAGGAEVGRHAEGLGAHLAVPAIEAAEVEVGVTVGQAASFDRVSVVDQKEEYIAIGGMVVVSLVTSTNGLCVMVDQSSRPGIFQRVSPVPSSAIFMTAATSSWSQIRP